MKITANVLIAVTLVLSVSNTSSAQVLKRLQQKAQEAVERKVEEKVEQKVQQISDQLLNNYMESIFGKRGTNPDGSPRPWPFQMGETVTTEEVYAFGTVVTMNIETFDQRGASNGSAQMLMHVNQDAQYTGTRIVSDDTRQNNADLFIIYDFKNEVMLMLMDSEGSKMSIGYAWTQADTLATAEMQPAEDVNWSELETWRGYRRIGTKTIAGYACDGYEVDDQNATTQLWVARDESLAWGGVLGANANTKQLQGKIPDEYPWGMLMELTTTSKTNAEKTVMNVTDINRRANVRYTMADYPQMRMGQ